MKDLDYNLHSHTFRCGHAEGEDEEYDSFDSVLTYISVDLEEKAEEIFGNDWLEEFEGQYN